MQYVEVGPFALQQTTKKTVKHGINQILHILVAEEHCPYFDLQQLVICINFGRNSLFHLIVQILGINNIP